MRITNTWGTFTFEPTSPLCLVPFSPSPHGHIMAWDLPQFPTCVLGVIAQGPPKPLPPPAAAVLWAHAMTSSVFGRMLMHGHIDLNNSN